MSRREVKFTCPKCGSHNIEEVMVDMTVASEIAVLGVLDGEVDKQYGDQTNEDGYVERYQCGGGVCGFIICDDQSKHADDGLDEAALVKAIDEINYLQKGAECGEFRG